MGPRRYRGACGLLFAMLASSAPAAAQVDADRSVPALDPSGFVGVTGTPTPGHLRWEAALVAGYLHGPLPGGAAAPLARRPTLDLEGELGLGERAAVALGLPVVLGQGGGDTALADPPASALADPRVAARYRFLGNTGTEGRPADGPGLGLQGKLYLPVGSEDALASDGRLGGELALAADFHLLGAGAIVRLGWVRRRLPRDAMSFAAGLRAPLPFYTPLVVALECRGQSDFQGESTTPVELDLGLRLRHGGFLAMLAGGLGLTDALGAPDARVLLGVRYRPLLDDKDGDGVPDDSDGCPLLPEDMDGFQDEDGCEDPDNDNDWVPDADDLCPNEEAIEGRDENEDGCTDP